MTRSDASIICLRLLTGAVFVTSGIAKAIDPWGFVIKISEYLAVWGMAVPRTLILVGAIALSAVEFVAGLGLATGCWRRWSPRVLMATMVVFLPLTLYIWIANPVSDCGCFGDMIHLSNAATFWKNVVLTSLLILLMKYNVWHRFNLFPRDAQWLVGVFATAYILVVAVYGYMVQPMIDFRPFAEGHDFKVDESEGEDIQFVYEKDGRRQTFDIDELPDDTWTFVERIDSDAEQSAYLTISDADGEDVTDEVLAGEGRRILLVITDAARQDLNDAYAVNMIARAVTAEGGDLVCVMADSRGGVDRWRDLSLAEYPCYTADDTQLKQLVRGDMALVVLDDGVVQWKRTVSSIGLDTIDRLARGDIEVDSLALHHGHRLRLLTAILAGLLVMIALFGNFIARLANMIKLRKFAKSKNIPTSNSSTMRKNIVAGNWKMNTTLGEGVGLAKDVNEALKGFKANCDVIICTPFTHLASVAAVIDGERLGLGAENCADHKSGAYTGEVSAAMVASTGATYVILGHSERRQYYGETSETLKEKIGLALENGLTPIFCIGEVLEQRENGTYLDVVKTQIEEALFDLSAEDFGKLILAYEPVWAIGTGKTATDDQAQEMHAFIRGVIADKYGKEVADNTSILYGGSCKPSNAAALFAKPDVDGGLIGGASLDAESFMGIVKAF